MFVMLPNTKIKVFAVGILIIIYLLQTHTTQHFTHKKYIVPCWIHFIISKAMRNCRPKTQWVPKAKSPKGKNWRNLSSTLCSQSGENQNHILIEAWSVTCNRNEKRWHGKMFFSIIFHTFPSRKVGYLQRNRTRDLTQKQSKCCSILVVLHAILSQI